MNFEEMTNIPLKTNQKGGLNYVSWADAWVELKKVYSNANYKVYESESGYPCFKDLSTLSAGGFVKVGVTIGKLEHIVYLPVMDYRNTPIQSDKITSFDVNKSIQRALVKAIAMHGLGIKVYQGEEFEDNNSEKVQENQSTTVSTFGKDVKVPCSCSVCGDAISEKVRDYSIKEYNKTLCYMCQKTEKCRVTDVDKK